MWDGNNLVAEYTSGGSELRHYYYGADAAPVSAETMGANNSFTAVAYHHTDALGSVRATSDYYGHILASSGFAPDGQTSASLTTPFGFAGMMLDAETRLYFDHARYYSPSQGRFLSPDPIGANGGINIYEYVGGDPLNGVDLTGLDDSAPEQIVVYGTYLGEGGFAGGIGGGRGGGQSEEQKAEVKASSHSRTNAGYFIPPTNPNVSSYTPDLAFDVFGEFSPDAFDAGGAFDLPAIPTLSISMTDGPIQPVYPVEYVTSLVLGGSIFRTLGSAILRQIFTPPQQIVFGVNKTAYDHAMRHLIGKGYDLPPVQAAIINDLTPNLPLAVGQGFKGDVTVDGAQIGYYAYGVSTDTGAVANVGQITPPR